VRVRAKYVEIITASAYMVADKWEKQYCINGKWSSDDNFQTYRKLRALGDDPSIGEVAKIIGNQSWSHISCAGCPNYVDIAVSIGNYEPRSYCFTCIREAHQVMMESEPNV
jgi:hypothetical protein